MSRSEITRTSVPSQSRRTRRRSGLWNSARRGILQVDFGNHLSDRKYGREGRWSLSRTCSGIRETRRNSRSELSDAHQSSTRVSAAFERQARPMNSVTLWRTIDAPPTVVRESMNELDQFMRASGFDEVHVDGETVRVANEMGSRLSNSRLNSLTVLTPTSPTNSAPSRARHSRPSPPVRLSPTRTAT